MKTTEELWVRCAAALHDQVSEAVWQMFISNIEPVSFDDSTMVLQVPNTVVRDRLESRFLPLIEATVSSGVGGPVRVRLTVVEGSGEGSAGARTPGTVVADADPAPAVGDPVAVDEVTSRGMTGRPGNGMAGNGRRPLAGGSGPTLREGPAVSLDDRFTFGAFVPAASNRLAYAAAQSVAETPGRSYNPLFIYGESGLGKTHLLHAIGNYVDEHFPTHRVLYLTTETFMNDFVDAIRTKSTIAFKRRYRDCDLLLIDDVQFMQNKEGLQEEFFHTYNDLHGAGKQIVLTSDRPPKSIETLEARLRSRFLSGLITKIDPPDLETRIAILKTKAEADHDDIPDDVLEFIATHVTDNIRELEGALVRVAAYASLTNEKLSVDRAEQVLHDLVSPGEQRQITPKMIVDLTAQHYGFTVEAICGPLRSRPLVLARQVAMYLIRNLTEYSYPAIGREFGNRDHTTVIHAVEKISAQMKERRQVYEQVTELIHQVKSSS